MALPIKTKEQIFTDMMTYAVSQGIAVTDFGVGSIVGEFFRACAKKIEEQYLEARIQWEATLDEFIYTSFNFQKKPGTKAVVNLIFTATNPVPSDVNIPAGTNLASVDGIEFQTTAASVISAGQTSSPAVPAIAKVAGISGNVFADTITTIVSTIGLVTGVSNPSPSSGGTDAETDAEMRDRFAIYVANLVKSNIPGLTAGALSVDGVRYADIVEDLGEKSVGTLTFYATPTPVVPIVIPKGTRVKTAGGVFFQTAVDGTLQAGFPSVTIVAAAMNRGSNGNILTGAAIILYDAIAGITSVSNTVEFLGGSNGVLGRIRLFVDDGSGSVSVPVMTEVQNTIEGDGTAEKPGYRPAGIVIDYMTPEVSLASWSQTVYHNDGVDVASLKNKIEENQQLYVNSLRLGEEVILAELVKIAKSVTGVRDVVLSAPSVNIVIGSEQVAKTGTIVTTMTVYAGV